ncbi:MAG: hypothetical protein Q8Q09_16060 [Deltaproteobacteria bacterium]|nr:hypothetical protein [Deltaproteobacteria bacterium]
MLQAPGTCSGDPRSCVSGTRGGACGDALTTETCVAGTWRCPGDTILVSDCACIGRPPGSSCVCTPSGWSCGGSDAGADAARDASTATFACGPSALCTRGSQYCEVFSGGAAGSSTRYTCRPLPAACPAPTTCDCVTRASGAPGSCSQSSTGDITVRIAAP